MQNRFSHDAAYFVLLCCAIRKVCRFRAGKAVYCDILYWLSGRHAIQSFQISYNVDYIIVLTAMEMLRFIFVSIFPFLCVSEIIKLGYITGSDTLPDRFYRRPGQAISGALTLALEEINTNSSILPNHTLDFLIAETYGIQLESIKETVDLINKDVSVYIGPQETCAHEAKVAAAFNIPMISYVSNFSKLK